MALVVHCTMRGKVRYAGRDELSDPRGAAEAQEGG